MQTYNKVFWTVILILFVSIKINGQTNSATLNKVWELEEVEPLAATMGNIGEKFMQLDFSHETLLVFKEGQQSDSISYNITGQEIRLFDKDKEPLLNDIILKMEHLSKKRFTLLFVTRNDNKKLVRLKYRLKN